MSKRQQTLKLKQEENLKIKAQKQTQLSAYLKNKSIEKNNKKSQIKIKNQPEENLETNDNDSDEDLEINISENNQLEENTKNSKQIQKQSKNIKKQKRKAAESVKSYKNSPKSHKFGKQELEYDEDQDLNEIPEENQNEIEENKFNNELEVDEEEILEKLPRNRRALQKMLENVEERLEYQKDQFFQEEHEGQYKKSNVGDNAIPICADITTFDFQHLKDAQMRHGGKMFDVIMMDPPWQLSTSQPSRGVAIAYHSLVDDSIQKMPIETLQTNGYIFIWAINAKYRISVQIMEKWGYKLVDEISWVKKTVNGKIAKGHGFYLQHAKESCLIGYKGDISDERFKKNIASDVIFSERRGQSQKPTEIYEYAEQLVPNGFYLEIFGRRNNLRNGWVTIGNEL